MRKNPSSLSDEQLVGEIKQLISQECRSLAELLSLLAEMDERRLYATLGFSSLFTFVVQELHLSEDAAYKRIHAARAARRFPVILPLISEGRINLTTVTILSPILTEENHAELLMKSVHMSKLEVERMKAAYAPKPDVPDMIRALPELTRSRASCGSGAGTDPSQSSSDRVEVSVSAACEERSAAIAPPITPARRDSISPLSEQRIKFQFTGSEELRSKIERAKALLRHKYPAARLEEIIDEALDAFLEKKDPEKRGERKARKSAPSQRPQRSGDAHTRYIPQHVKDLVWQRDQGRCQYVSADSKRCETQSFLEFDHVQPFAKGGSSKDPQNIRLLCHAHNQLTMRSEYGEQKRYPQILRRPAASLPRSRADG